MLKVYGWNQCPHCHRTVEWLRSHHVSFEYYEIEDQPASMIEKIIDVNGGDDWVVPTLEYMGKWRAGEIFDPLKLESDLKELGAISS